MSHTRPALAPPSRRPPRTSGDEPPTQNRPELYVPNCPPRTSGDEPAGRWEQVSNYYVRPARAGMSLGQGGTDGWQVSPPRTSGDEPAARRSMGEQIPSAPHERG